MNIQEFSRNFDILYNNVMSNASTAAGLNEYEKSVFLTKAQDELIKNYFNPKGNKYQEGFDGNEKRQIDFSTLIKTYSAIPYIDNTYVKFDDRSFLYQLPKDIMFVLNETATIIDGDKTFIINIIPINYNEYSKIMGKPYKQPLKTQGWRLFQSNGTADYISEVIVKYNTTISKYTVRYVKKPKPIILEDLNTYFNGASIDGVSTVSTCELHPSIHNDILQRAVELAKITYSGEPASIVQTGQRSE